MIESGQEYHCVKCEDGKELDLSSLDIPDYEGLLREHVELLENKLVDISLIIQRVFTDTSGYEIALEDIGKIISK